MDGYIRHTLGKFKKSDGYMPAADLCNFVLTKTELYVHCRSGSS